MVCANATSPESNRSPSGSHRKTTRTPRAPPLRAQRDRDEPSDANARHDLGAARTELRHDLAGVDRGGQERRIGAKHGGYDAELAGVEIRRERLSELGDRGRLSACHGRCAHLAVRVDDAHEGELAECSAHPLRNDVQNRWVVSRRLSKREGAVGYREETLRRPLRTARPFVPSSRRHWLIVGQFFSCGNARLRKSSRIPGRTYPPSVLSRLR